MAVVDSLFQSLLDVVLGVRGVDTGNVIEIFLDFGNGVNIYIQLVDALEVVTLH